MAHQVKLLRKFSDTGSGVRVVIMSRFKFKNLNKAAMFAWKMSMFFLHTDQTVELITDNKIVITNHTRFHELMWGNTKNVSPPT